MSSGRLSGCCRACASLSTRSSGFQQLGRAEPNLETRIAVGRLRTRGAMRDEAVLGCLPKPEEAKKIASRYDNHVDFLTPD